MTHRIAILGPESSGKSVLCNELALRFDSIAVPEYARIYLDQIKRPYHSGDLEVIYREQFRIETAMLASGKRFIFTDTEFIIGKVWHEHVYGTRCLYMDEMIEKHPYDFYLLTAADLPWEYDRLRENPGKGAFFFSWYESILIERKLPYGVVSGSGSARTESAINLIEARFGKG